MDLLKASLYIIVVMMGVNAMAMMMEHVGMVSMTPLNTTEVLGGLNTTELVDSWGWTDNQFYDIATGLVSFWFSTVPIIESFPHMLAVYGCPAFIYVPLHTIWRFMWFSAVALCIIAGRQT